VVAKAAKCASANGHHELIESMLASFDNCMAEPLKNDKLCHAKFALIEALDDLDHQDPDLYRIAAQHIQMEPVYGGYVDSAAKLRGRAGVALTRCMDPEIYFILGDLLMDSEPETRSLAAQAISAQGGERGELLLRCRILSGDKITRNFGDYFTALLQINPERSLEFVASYLNSPDLDLWQEAVLALGESRCRGSCEKLSAQWKQIVNANQRKVLILAIALLRSDEAIDFLCNIISDHPLRDAKVAIQASAIYLANDSHAALLRSAATKNSDPEVLQCFREH